MDIQLKKRIVGIALLLALGLLLAPLFLTRSLPVNELQLSAKVPAAPEKPATLLAALPGKAETIPAIVNSTATAPQDPDSVQPDSRIAFEQDESANTVATAPIAASQPEASSSTPLAPPPSAAETPVVQQTAQPVPPPAPTTPSNPNPIQASSVKVQSNGIPNAYVVQLGSFSAKINAEKMVKQLQSKGFPAYLRTTKTAKGVWVRVLVGPQLRRSDAEKQLQKLNEQFETKGMIVKANP